MVRETTFEYLAEAIAEGMRKEYARSIGSKSKDKELQNYGRFDRKKRDYRVTILMEVAEAVVCSGDYPKYVLCDLSGRRLYGYCGRSWEAIDSDGFMAELMRRVYRRLGVGGMYMAGASLSARELEMALRCSDRFAFRPNRRYIAFDNGVFDLEKGKLNPPKPDYVTDLVFDFEYKSELECRQAGYETFKLWERFVSDRDTGVFPNPSVARDAQLAFGALLLDRSKVKYEKLVIVHGPGRNGKSVFVDAVTAVFGERYISTFTPDQLFKQGTNSGFCCADLEDKLVNVVGDLDNRDFSGGSLKSYISGGKIMAREVWGKKNRPVKPPIMVCCTNEFPECKDDSEGHHQRLLPLESTHRMWTDKDKDPMLTSKLTTPIARACVFLWLYEGYNRIMKTPNCNIPLSDYTLEAMELFKSESNSMRRWWFDSPWKGCQEGCGVLRPLSELYKEYREYCHERDLEVRNATALSKMLISKGVIKKHKRGGSHFWITRKTDEDYQD